MLSFSGDIYAVYKKKQRLTQRKGSSNCGNIYPHQEIQETNFGLRKPTQDFGIK